MNSTRSSVQGLNHIRYISTLCFIGLELHYYYIHLMAFFQENNNLGKPAPEG